MTETRWHADFGAQVSSGMESFSSDLKVDSHYSGPISSKSSPINSMLYAPWCTIMSLPIPTLQQVTAKISQWYIPPASQCYGQLGFPHEKRPVSFLSINPSKSEAKKELQIWKARFVALPSHGLPSHFHYISTRTCYFPFDRIAFEWYSTTPIGFTDPY